MSKEPYEVIEELQELNNKYRECRMPQDGTKVVEIMRTIASNLAYLETVRAEVHELFNQTISDLTKEKKMAFNRAEIQAHLQVPLMYKLRRVMDGYYTLIDIMRSEVSYHKQEKNFSHTQK